VVTIGCACAARSLARGGLRKPRKGGDDAPPFPEKTDEAAGYFFAAVRFFAVDGFAVRLFAAGFRAAVRFLAVRLFVVRFLAAVFRVAVFRFRVFAAFFAAVFRVAVFRFLVAAPFLAAAFLFAVDLFFAGDIVTPFRCSGRHTLEASPFPLAHPSPHPVPLVAAQGVVETLDTNGTVSADPLGLPR
jgi:hypothetical protein